MKGGAKFQSSPLPREGLSRCEEATYASSFLQNYVPGTPQRSGGGFPTNWT